MESTPLIGGYNSQSGTPRFLLIIGYLLAIVLVTVAIGSLAVSVKTRNEIQSQSFPDKCEFSTYQQAYQFGANPSTKTTKGRGPGHYVLIENAVIWTGTGKTLSNYDILISPTGQISQIAPTPLKPDVPEENLVIYNMQGAFLTPGLVDIHSHLGVYGFPEDAFGPADGNEMTNPTFPQVRAVDALDPEDPAIPQIVSGGVTAAVVLPGSGNTMGGEGVMVKLRGTSASDMLIPGAPRVLKMAAGENPKRVYGSKDQTPMSRMGNIWVMRNMLAQAMALKIQQDEWDCAASTGVTQLNARPYSASLEPLIALIRGQAYLFVHAYKIHDFEAIIRLQDEFGIQIRAFHHAMEAWKVPSFFSKRNITIATFADLWGFKMESYDGSVKAPYILSQNGVNVALKSDHPVLFARWLYLEAAKAYHYGLDAETALRSMTVIPAQTMGLLNFFGTVEVGKDADLVAWTQHPLVLGSTPFFVTIEGEVQINNPLTSAPTTFLPPVQNATFCTPGLINTNSFAFTNVPTVWDMTTENPLTNVNLVVENGLVTCVGASGVCDVPPTVTTVWDLLGTESVILPGSISTSGYIGLWDVESEGNSQDGDHYTEFLQNVNAVDGIRLGGRHVSAAWAGGVSVQITEPQGKSLIGGVSVAYYTTGTTISDSILQESVALHIHIGNTAKGDGGYSASISGQMSDLRGAIQNSLELQGPTDPVLMACNGSIPLVVHVDLADEMDVFLRLREKFCPNSKLVIFGGSESAYLSKRLATVEGLYIVLAPLRKASGSDFENLRGKGPTTPSLLNQAGIQNIALAIDDAGNVRNLRWEAGIARGFGLGNYNAIASITKNVAGAFGLLGTGLGQILASTPANFVVYSADPLAIHSTISLMVANQVVECSPQQY